MYMSKLKFLPLLCFTELWERFSYYGMRALLILFLVSQLGFEDVRAYAVYSLFAFLGYLGPSVAGIVADKVTGFSTMVFSGGIVITLGHFVMAMGADSEFMIFWGIALIAVGCSLFKGNITNLLGLCYKKSDNNRTMGFTWFFMFVNIGSAAAAISCGVVAKIYGWHYGFGLAGIGMLIGLVIYWMLYNNVLDRIEEVGNKDKKICFLSSFVTIIISILISGICYHLVKNAEYFIEYANYTAVFVVSAVIYIIHKSSYGERKRIYSLLVLILFTAIFFGLEMQIGSLVNLFVERNVDMTFLGYKLPASISQSINPMSIMLFGFVVTTIIKPSEKRGLFYFGIGILTMILACASFYIGCMFPNIEGETNVAFTIVSLAFMGIGELFIVPFIHSKTTNLSPERYKGFMMGVLMFFLAYSNLAGKVIAKFMSVPKGYVSRFESLAIYKTGFMTLSNFYLVVFLLFLFSTFFIRSVVSPKDDE